MQSQLQTQVQPQAKVKQIINKLKKLNLNLQIQLFSNYFYCYNLASSMAFQSLPKTVAGLCGK